MVGVGFRAKLEQHSIFLKCGYCHWLQVPIPDDLSVQVATPTKIIIQSADLHLATQFAAKLRKYRKPEPYNGKGIFVNDEKVRRKEVKKK
jgi:large subunit ribosomal protein L6